MKRSMNDGLLTKQDLLDALHAQEARILAVTRQDLQDALQGFATKDDLKAFTTKEDLKAFATKDDLRGFATKDDLQSFATKDDLQSFATKDDLQSFATKQDLQNFATKDDLGVFATKEDLRGLAAATKEDINGVIEVIQDLSMHIDTRFNRLEKDVKRIDKKLDAAVLQNNIQDSQLTRHECWHHQVAQKLRIELG